MRGWKEWLGTRQTKSCRFPWTHSSIATSWICGPACVLCEWIRKLIPAISSTICFSFRRWSRCRAWVDGGHLLSHFQHLRLWKGVDMERPDLRIREIGSKGRVMRIDHWNCAKFYSFVSIPFASIADSQVRTRENAEYQPSRLGSDVRQEQERVSQLVGKRSWKTSCRQGLGQAWAVVEQHLS